MAHTKMALNQKTTTGKTEPPLEPPRSTQAKTGLEFLRFFADGKVSPLDAVAWERRTAQISNEKGQTIFRQENVEVPKTWSQTATNIVASKYFHGKLNTPERESSVRRSEEHTSELQSPCNLVCRLLLEKKKKQT